MLVDANTSPSHTHNADFFPVTVWLHATLIDVCPTFVVLVE
jgi:hypothetical protein